MSGQHPGPFGPSPGGPAYGPAYGPGPLPAAGPAPVPGRFGTPARVLCALAPLLSAGLLGAVPSLLLALRRRRAYDIAGAVVFCALLLTLFVSAGIAGSLHDPTADLVGQITLGVLWFAPTVHFLVMDSRAVWEAGRPAPKPALPPYGRPPVSPYGPTVPGYGAPSAPAPAPAAAPTPAPAPSPARETAHDLRELGELLRRQAREGRS
ncbi:hypothetical protein [Kitasatospora sp. SUK 42]|uniref:hypothetical protein n=1 Tax=Kitasatospora sp. SUK 42 TaxID=1588882 RepID=UPI0018CB7FFC|nr:hypothetical protein [Kitasatospora sp. SUK 42]MBV2152289.1 hypothetical protein [Kitasatospora sp. SUK 42]